MTTYRSHHLACIIRTYYFRYRELDMSDVISSKLTESEKDSWATPQWLFDALDREFVFGLDAAANNDNHKVERFLTIEDDALNIEDWSQHILPIASDTVWINPPYSRGMVKAFIDKAREQCTKNKLTIVLLVPATPDASWWPTDASEIRFITQGRISFEHPISKKPVNGNTKGSALIIFRHIDLGSPMVTRWVERASLIESAAIRNQEAA